MVIVAGYTEPMSKFFESNPGLKSRFNTFIEFRDFSGAELIEIMASMCRKNNYCLSDSAAELLNDALLRMAEEKGEQFANGRLVRNIFDSLVMNHARRVFQLENATKKQLMEITSEDIKSYLDNLHKTCNCTALSSGH